MKKEDLLKEYTYYYESYLYYDVVKKQEEFAKTNLDKCNLLADLFLRYFDGNLEELYKVSAEINKDFIQKKGDNNGQSQD